MALEADVISTKEWMTCEIQSDIVGIAKLILSLADVFISFVWHKVKIVRHFFMTVVYFDSVLPDLILYYIVQNYFNFLLKIFIFLIKNILSTKWHYLIFFILNNFCWLAFVRLLHIDVRNWIYFLVETTWNGSRSCY